MASGWWFSGIQPSGHVHLGNYLGAIKRWAAEQRARQGENHFCVVDLHSLTVPQDPELLRRHTRSLAAMPLAAGLDPGQCTLFVDSSTSAPARRGVLAPDPRDANPAASAQSPPCSATAPRAEESVGAGWLDYPVLMAADILLYDTDEVPVGEDQQQHVELARDIAERFNRLHGEMFVLPAAVIPAVGARVMGLDDPTAKMSKSYAHVEGHAIRMLDAPDAIRRAISRAVTDSGREIRFSDDPARAGVNNLLGIYQAVTGKTPPEVEADFADARGYGDLKRTVTDVVIAALTPIRERHAALMQDPAELDRLLARGADRARAVAGPKLDEMKRRMGLILPA